MSDGRGSANGIPLRARNTFSPNFDQCAVDTTTMGFRPVVRTAIPHAEYHIIADAGHATCWENAAEFNSIILGFLTKQEGGPM